MRKAKRVLALILSLVMISGLFTAQVSAEVTLPIAVGKVDYSNDGTDVTAKVKVSADSQKIIMMLVSYDDDGNMLDIKKASEKVDGEEEISAKIGSQCKNIVAMVMDKDGKMLVPAANYGVDSLELEYLKVNGELVDDFNSITKAVFQTDEIEASASAKDGSTGVKIISDSDKKHAKVLIESERGQEKTIDLYAYDNEDELSELKELSYTVGDTKYPVDLTKFISGEQTIELAEGTMSVALATKSIGDVSIKVQDTIVNEIDGVNLGNFHNNNGDGITAFTAERPAINNVVPIKSEVGKATILVTYNGISTRYVLNFKAKQPRLTSFEMSDGAKSDKYPPAFVGGSAVNNDNGTLIANDRQWIVSNISKNLVGGSCFCLPGDNLNNKDTSRWWANNSSGAYFTFTADTGGTAYMIARNFVSTPSGWTKVSGLTDTAPAWPDGYTACTTAKWWNDYTTPAYYMNDLEYNSTSGKERPNKPGWLDSAISGVNYNRNLSYCYKYDFNAGDEVTVYHTGKAGANDAAMVVIKWDDSKVSYAPLGEAEVVKALDAELPELTASDTKCIMDLKFDASYNTNNAAVWPDLSGNENNLSVDTTKDYISWTDKGLSVTGTSGGANRPVFTKAVQDVLKKRTCTLQFKLSSMQIGTGKTYNPVFSNNSAKYMLCQDSSGKTRFNIGNSTANTFISISNFLDFTKVNTIVLDKAHKQYKWYVGETLASEDSIPSFPDADPTDDIGLSFTNTTASMLNGNVVFEKITVYDKMLTAAEVKETVNPTVKKAGGKISVSHKTKQENAPVIMLAEGYSWSDVTTADETTLKKAVLYASAEKAQDGQVNTTVYVSGDVADGKEYDIFFGDGTEKVFYVNEETKKNAVSQFLIDQSYADYFCDKSTYDSFTPDGQENVKAYAKELLPTGLTKDTPGVTDEIGKALGMALVIEKLNENKSVEFADIISNWYGEDKTPANFVNNVKDTAKVAELLKNKAFETASDFKNAYYAALLINNLSDSNSKLTDIQDKRRILENNAAFYGLDLSKYYESSTDRTAVISEIAKDGTITDIASLQNAINNLSDSLKYASDKAQIEAKKIEYKNDGTDVTASVKVTANNVDVMLLVCSYAENGAILEKKAVYKNVGGVEVLTAKVSNDCSKIVATLLDGNGKMIVPSAVYGTESTDLLYIKVNGKYLDNVNSQDKFSIQTGSISVDAMAKDGTTGVSVENDADGSHSTIYVESARGQKRTIEIFAYSDAKSLTKLKKLSYKIGDTEYPVNVSELENGEMTIALPENTLKVQLLPQAAGNVSVSVQDEIVSSFEDDPNEINLGSFYYTGGGDGKTAYTSTRPAIDNMIPIKNEIGKAYITTESDGVKNEYTIKFTAKQPRLTKFEMSENAANDQYKPTFISGSALNNDNGTLLASDRGWIVSNISKTLVGGSCFVMSGDNTRDKNPNQWWGSHTDGDYFTFAAERGGTAYVISGTTFTGNAPTRYKNNGWTELNNTDIEPTWPENYGASTTAKWWNDYDKPLYYMNCLEYKAAENELRLANYGWLDNGVTGSHRQMSCIYQKKFTKGQDVTVYHTGRTDANGAKVMVIIRWDGINYDETSQGSIAPELAELQSVKVPLINGSNAITRKTSEENAYAMLLNKKDAENSYTWSDVVNAVKAGDTKALDKAIAYFTPATVEGGKASATLLVSDDSKVTNGEYKVLINGTENSVQYVDDASKQTKITAFLNDGSYADVFCNKDIYDGLSNKENAVSFAKSLLTGVTDSDPDAVNKIQAAISLGLIIEMLNENQSVSIDDVKNAWYGSCEMPDRLLNNVKEPEKIITNLKNKNFRSVDAFKKAYYQELFVKIMNDKTSRNMTYPDKKAFLENYADLCGVSLTAYNKNGVDRQKAVTQLAKQEAVNSISVLQETLDRLCVVTPADPSHTSPGGGGGSSLPSSTLGGSAGTAGGTSTEGILQLSFNDMQAYEWAKNAVEYLRSKGIVSGYNDGSFKPQNSVTRAEFVTMIVKAYLSSQIATGDKFKDVTADKWFYNSVMVAMENGIVNGVSDNEFMPDNYISRQDMAVILCNLAKKLGISIEDKDAQFADNGKIADYAKAAVSFLKAAGVVNGDDNGAFNPTKNANRAESAQMIYAFMSFVQKGAVK